MPPVHTNWQTFGFQQLYNNIFWSNATNFAKYAIESSIDRAFGIGVHHCSWIRILRLQQLYMCVFGDEDTDAPGCGLWTAWSNWSECSTGCDDRSRTRTRACRVGNCDGDDVETHSCPTLDCPGANELSISFLFYKNACFRYNYDSVKPSPTVL